MLHKYIISLSRQPSILIYNSDRLECLNSTTWGWLGSAINWNQNIYSLYLLITHTSLKRNLSFIYYKEFCLN